MQPITPIYKLIFINGLKPLRIPPLFKRTQKYQRANDADLPDRGEDNAAKRQAEQSAEFAELVASLQKRQLRIENQADGGDGREAKHPGGTRVRQTEG